MIEQPISQSILSKYFHLKSSGVASSTISGSDLKASSTASCSDLKPSCVASSATSRSSKATSAASQDPAYQLRRHLIEIAAKIVNCLFQCGKAKAQELEELPKLADFIHRVLRRTNLSNNNLLTALIYLIRLKQRHPGCKGAYGSGHRLFLAAIVSANKYLHDDAYHNKSWATVANGLFTLSEINQMESELLFYLNFKLVVTKEQWLDFLALMKPKLLKSWARQGYEGPSDYLFESCTANIDNPLGFSKVVIEETLSPINVKRIDFSMAIENLDLALLGGRKERRASVPSLPPVWELLAQKNSTLDTNRSPRSSDNQAFALS